METDLQVGWAKQSSPYWPETDVLLSEPLRARRLRQALGEPPMRSGGEMSLSHSLTSRNGHTLFDCDTALVVLSFNRCAAGPLLGADFCGVVFDVEDVEWVTGNPVGVLIGQVGRN